MKKAVSFILALILVSMLLLPVGAEENASSMLVTKGALTYAIDDNFTIVACDPAVHVKDCTLPGIIDGYKVVRIGKDAFKDCTLLTDIKILEETTDIDEGAFSGCTALTKIFIPSSMVSIGEGAFSRCTNLTDVYKGNIEDAIRISTDAYGDRLDRLYQWFSGIDNIDTRNYFGVDDHEVFSDYSDYEKAYLQIKSGTQISFSSGNARLEYSDGEVKSSNNVSGPYSLRSDGDNDDGEIEFCIEKQQLGKDGFCSVSNDAGGNELTIINDGWSVSIVSDKPIQISMDNTEQSVKIQSEEKGLLSAWLTQNTPSANSAWYGTAVDVNDAKELILTPTSEGVKVNSDNMQDARVTVNGDGTFASKAINTTKNEILVQEDADATIGDCIKIQGTYTIRASVGLHGTISPAGYVAVDAGGTQTFTFTPDEGYTVEHVKVNGKNKGEITDYTFKKVKKDQEIEVTFREKTEQDSEPKEKSGYGPILDWILSIIEWIKHWFQA